MSAKKQMVSVAAGRVVACVADKFAIRHRPVAKCVKHAVNINHLARKLNLAVSTAPFCAKPFNASRRLVKAKVFSKWFARSAHFLTYHGLLS
jgi:hypothetical protein